LMEYEQMLDEAYVRETKFLGVFGRFAGRYSDASLVGVCVTDIGGRALL